MFLNNSTFMIPVVLFALRITIRYSIYLGFPGGTVVKNPPANAGMLEMWVRSLGQEMATYSSILVWKIPWTEEPCGPQSMGSLRAGHG